MLQRVFGFLFFAFAVLVGGQAAAEPEKTDVIIVAGGCFWCVESIRQSRWRPEPRCPGISAGKPIIPHINKLSPAIPSILKPSLFASNPAKLSCEKLLDVFWRSVDPTDGGG